MKMSEEKVPIARRVTSRLITDVMENLRGICLIPSTVTPPAWIEGEVTFPANEILPARNMLVHLPSLIAGKPDFSIPPTPRFFTTFALVYDFDLSAPNQRSG